MTLVRVKDQDDIISEFPSDETYIINMLEEHGYLHVLQIEEKYKTSKVRLLKLFAHKSRLSDQILIAISNHGAFYDDKLTRMYYIFKSVGSSILLNNKCITFDYYSQNFQSGISRYSSCDYLISFYRHIDKVERFETSATIVVGAVDKGKTHKVFSSLLPSLRFTVRAKNLYIEAKKLREYLAIPEF